MPSSPSSPGRSHYEQTSTAAARPPSGRRGVFRALGLGLITGAADDDPSAIGTYASAGARLGPGFLWTAPVTMPMMFAVVYLSSKLGQVSGMGLFDAIRRQFPKWILYPTLVGVLIGNTIEAGADLGGMAAALQLLVPIPAGWIVGGVTVAVLALQVFGSYTLIRNVFRWLALSLLAYVGAAILARPSLRDVIAGTLVPRLSFDRDSLSLLVAVIGTTLSAYLYTWQSNEEVEEEIAMGRRTLAQRRGATDEELRRSRWDIALGMFFSNMIMYFIILSTGAALYRGGKRNIETAADAAQALRPIAGSAASVLFAAGVVAVGFLAVPIMTTGAAYDLSQSLGWKHSLSARPRQAKKFYAAIVGFTLVGMSMNFFGVNPMRMLVFSGIVQGFSTPPLLLMIMILTNRKSLMGDRVNGTALNVLGWITTAAIFAASLCLVWTWLR
jgi:NRAMP (natural resistance-associated macrophage protein)-like metal ion transporter